MLIFYGNDAKEASQILSFKLYYWYAIQAKFGISVVQNSVICGIWVIAASFEQAVRLQLFDWTCGPEHSNCPALIPCKQSRLNSEINSDMLPKLKRPSKFDPFATTFRTRCPSSPFRPCYICWRRLFFTTYMWFLVINFWNFLGFRTLLKVGCPRSGQRRMDDRFDPGIG